ncbi:RNA methyltransferase [Aliiglaciecola sp. CAU 1673]|uniref:TrmH family RNA methyltransferase n=1 Tax=Aliiglaciecola sp. CAU 1673 TaxID=3032595 RepID=UPI0023DBB930|nr:RNA methyltransferase [Aliiglaciecola sp. CAU 1673]MDF2180199.1 RNA methyltransferase [Aliiglaciecola sp. CAU 1673]
MNLSDVKKLHQKKYRSQFGHYLVEGEHLVLELQKAMKKQQGLGEITLYVTDNYLDWVKKLDMAYSLVPVSEKQMALLSDTKSPQGIIALVPMPKALRDKPTKGSKERCIYLYEVQDPGNLGTIIRTLAWFGSFRLLLSPNSVDPFNPKVVRASMGAIFHLPIELDVELIDLENRFDQFAYLDMQGSPIGDPKFGGYQCYLFGNEARGVPSEALTSFNAQAFTIEGCGNIDSLNLASAVNICAYQLSV